MQTSNRFFEDLARVAGGAASAMTALKEEFEGMVRQQFERYMDRMDLVPREEFEAVKDVASRARAEQEALEQRVAALEAKLARRPARKKPKPAP